MDCMELKPILLEYVDGERDASICQNFIEHTKSCSDCLNRYNFEVKFRDFYKAGLKPEPASAELKNRVRVGIENSASKVSWGEKIGLFLFGKPVAWAGPALAGVLVVLLILAYSFFKEKNHTIVAEFVEEHEEYLEQGFPLQITSDNPQEVDAWFKEKVGYDPSISDIAGQDFVLMGGMTVEMWHKKVACVCLKKKDVWVSWFVLPDDKLPIPQIQKIQKGDKELYFTQEDKFNLVLWKEKGKLFSLVSELNLDELINLASIT